MCTSDDYEIRANIGLLECLHSVTRRGRRAGRMEESFTDANESESEMVVGISSEMKKLLGEKYMRGEGEEVKSSLRVRMRGKVQGLVGHE